MVEQVLILSPSSRTAQDIAITGMFSALIPANDDRAGLHRRTYPDCAVVKYDSEAHQQLSNPARWPPGRSLPTENCWTSRRLDRPVTRLPSS